MSDSNDLKIPELFPDDLKNLLRELKIPLSDPVIPLMVWLWKQLIDTKQTLDNAKMSVSAVFQDRTEKMQETADLLISTNKLLQEIDQQIEARPLNIKEQVEKELTEPIKQAADSCKKLDDEVRSVINRLDSKLGRTQQRLNVALFTSGFMGGGLIIACLFHLWSSR